MKFFQHSKINQKAKSYLWSKKISQKCKNVFISLCSRLRFEYKQTHLLTLLWKRKCFKSMFRSSNSCNSSVSQKAIPKKIYARYQIFSFKSNANEHCFPCMSLNVSFGDSFLPKKSISCLERVHILYFVRVRHAARYKPINSNWRNVATRTKQIFLSARKRDDSFYNKRFLT